jgi:hypothetical protein
MHKAYFGKRSTLCRARDKNRTSNESRAACVLHGTFGNAWESAEIRRFLSERVAARFDEKNVAMSGRSARFY